MQNVKLAELRERTRLSRRMLIDARTGHRRPHPNNQAKIAGALKAMGVIRATALLFLFIVNE
jgi:hypothetical protein